MMLAVLVFWVIFTFPRDGIMVERFYETADLLYHSHSSQWTSNLLSDMKNGNLMNRKMRLEIPNKVLNKSNKRIG